MEELDKWKKEFGNHSNFHSGSYKVPDNYFNELEDKLISRLEENDNKSKIRQLPRWTYAVAASFVLFISAWFIYSDGVEQDNSYLADISSEESLDYLLESDMSITEDDLLELENIDEVLLELEKEIIK